jgi:hypothetical protein
MNKLFLTAILLAVTLLILGACTSPETSTQVGETELSVEIHSSQEGEVLEIASNGQKIPLWVDPIPGVSFQWKLTGSGDLTNKTDPSIQYEVPQSVEGEEEVLVTVTATNPKTNHTASDYIVIRLRPSTSIASVPDASIPGSGELQLDPAKFIVQDSQSGEEFFLDTRFGDVPGLPLDDGVDLSNYVLEFTVQGGDGKEVQLYFKNSNWENVFAYPKQIVSGQPIRFDPAVDDRDVDQFQDFTHIYAVGAKIWGGVQGVKIVSARLIGRDAPSPSTPSSSEEEALQLEPTNFAVQGTEFLLDTRYGAIPDLPHDDGVNLSGFVLEITFQGGDGKEVQLFFKDSNWGNVYSKRKQIISGQPLRFDPAVDPRDVDDFQDFTRIYGIGAKIDGGIEGVNITSARLIKK